MTTTGPGRSPSDARQHRVRLYHRKSRTGCQRCKARRVKCDELRPVCGSCARHEVSCVYEHGALSDVSPSLESRSSSLRSPSSSHLSSETDQEHVPAPRRPQPLHGVPESEARRLLELRLMTNYMHIASRVLSLPRPPEFRRIWWEDVPRMAREHRNVMYSLFTISASHILRIEGPSPELEAAHEQYLGLALSEQRQAVGELGPHNADAVCFAALFILIEGFVSLQRRPLQPYSPPIEWLNVGRGAGTVFTHTLHNIIKDLAQAKIAIVLLHLSDLRDVNSQNDWLVQENRWLFANVLAHDPDRDGPVDELADAETREAYEKVLGYIGSVEQAMGRNTTVFILCRRIVAFAALVPELFLRLVEAGRPRALVALAHFFALTHRLRHVWYIGHSGRREVHAVYGAVPAGWRPAMEWPMGVVAEDEGEGEERPDAEGEVDDAGPAGKAAAAAAFGGSFGGGNGSTGRDFI